MKEVMSVMMMFLVVASLVPQHRSGLLEHFEKSLSSFRRFLRSSFGTRMKLNRVNFLWEIP